MGQEVLTSQAVIDVYSVSLYTFVGQWCFNFTSRQDVYSVSMWDRNVSTSRAVIDCKPIYVRGTGVFQLLKPSLTYIL